MKMKSQNWWPGIDRAMVERGFTVGYASGGYKVYTHPATRATLAAKVMWGGQALGLEATFGAIPFDPPLASLEEPVSVGPWVRRVDPTDDPEQDAYLAARAVLAQAASAMALVSDRVASLAEALAGVKPSAPGT